MEAPTTATVMVTKPSKDAKLGITLRGEGTIKIIALKQDGLFSDTILEVDMEIDTINGEKFANATEAVTLLKEAEGQVTIVARKATMEAPTTATVMVTKPSKDAKLGITLRGEGTIKIIALKQDGLFSDTILEVDMEIDTINGEKFVNATEAVTLLKEVEGQVTIVARKATTDSNGNSNPPGAPPGGIWGMNTYVGDKTNTAACVGFLCCCIPGLLICLCPFDERDAYKKDNAVYLADGKKLPSGAKFVPKRQRMQR